MRTREYEEIYSLEDSYWWFVGRRRLVRQLLERHRPEAPAPMQILDVGCGTGGTMKALEDAGEVYGCDASPTALRFCKERGFRRLFCTIAEKLALGDNSFDVVVNCDVLEHIEDDRGALGQMYRVLRPGGLLILTVPAHPYLWSEHDEALAHLRRYTRREFTDKLQEAGYRIEKLSAAVSFVFPGILAFRLLQRLFRNPSDEPKTDLRILPGPINTFLVKLLHIETEMMKYTNLPIGTSFVAVAQKPH